MARISELHYSNALAGRSGLSEFLEVALDPSENPADFTVSFYQHTGAVGIEVRLDDPRVSASIDPQTGEQVFVLMAGPLPILLTDPDGNGSNNYEAFALTQTGASPAQVIDFYDIGGGTRNIAAQDGAAAGAVSENVVPPTGPQQATTSIQWNQPNPGTPTFETISEGDTGIACFTAGTLIDTPQGSRAVEDLAPGDPVWTLDSGVQPLRWIGIRRVRGTGDLAPIRIAAGAFGAQCDLLVSPRHRLLVSGWQAELLFAEPEVLLAAKDLVNDTTVRPAPCARVTYVHLLFEAHQIVQTQGLRSESFLPGRYTLETGPLQTREEILHLFPQLEAGQGEYGTSARRICSGREAALIAPWLG